MMQNLITDENRKKIMPDFQKMELPPETLRVYAIVSFIFFFFLVLVSNISIAGMQSILNTYIIVEIAIISVAFIVMSIKQCDTNKQMYNNLFAVACFSAIILFMDVLTYFYSFIDSTNDFFDKIGLASVTWMTFLSLFMLIIVFFEYFFEIVETTEQSKLE
jgi:Kef-type K+ transport system membrane component KefB